MTFKAIDGNFDYKKVVATKNKTLVVSSQDFIILSNE